MNYYASIQISEKSLEDHPFKTSEIESFGNIRFIVIKNDNILVFPPSVNMIHWCLEIRLYRYEINSLKYYICVLQVRLGKTKNVASRKEMKIIITI